MMTFNNRGVSLVELLVGIAVIGLIMAGMVGILTSGLQSTRHNTSMGRIMAPGRNAVNNIADGIRFTATSISEPAVNGSYGQLTYRDGTSTYVVQRNSTAKSIVVTKDGVVQSPSPLAVGIVESLNFKRGADKRDITIEATFKDPDNPNSPSQKIVSQVIAVNVK